MIKEKRYTRIENIGQLVVKAGQSWTYSRAAMDRGYSNESEVLSNAFCILEGNKVIACGLMKDLSARWREISLRNQKEKENWVVINADQRLVTPGWIDSHTHPLFAGDRSVEFGLKLDGVSYQEIASRGGGILNTLKATRAASDESLINLAFQRLRAMLSNGVTAMEVKSGYGLSVEEELRHLKLLKHVKDKGQWSLHITALPLHAVPPGASKAQYIKQINDEFLPEAFNNRLCDSFDVFIENGYFLPEDCQEYAKNIKEHGFGLRVHADEFSDSDGAEFAAHWKAESADHLQMASANGIKQMAEAGTMANLLPGTSLYSGIPFTQAKPFSDQGVPIAVSTDFNPGSCRIMRLPLIASLAGVHCRLKAMDVLAAVTHVPAVSLGWKDKGHLYPGADADLCLWPVRDINELLGVFGEEKPTQVWVAGRRQSN